MSYSFSSWSHLIQKFRDFFISFDFGSLCYHFQLPFFSAGTLFHINVSPFRSLNPFLHVRTYLTTDYGHFSIDSPHEPIMHSFTNTVAVPNYYTLGCASKHFFPLIGLSTFEFLTFAIGSCHVALNLDGSANIVEEHTVSA